MKVIKQRPKIIAIDFDQTIADGDSFPDASTSNILGEAKKYINLLHEEGYYIII